MDVGKFHSGQLQAKTPITRLIVLGVGTWSQVASGHPFPDTNNKNHCAGYGDLESGGFRSPISSHNEVSHKYQQPMVVIRLHKASENPASIFNCILCAKILVSSSDLNKKNCAANTCILITLLS